MRGRLKIERIRSAEITRDSYTIPADFDPRKLLRDAWGIWYTEKEPVEVVLRFHPDVAMRVKESRWHHSQQIEETAGRFSALAGQDRGAAGDAAVGAGVGGGCGGGGAGGVETGVAARGAAVGGDVWRRSLCCQPNPNTTPTLGPMWMNRNGNS